MRDFSWKYFAMTGDVDAYLLYNQVNNQHIEAKQEELEEIILDEAVE